jgi:hypothetical protein
MAPFAVPDSVREFLQRNIDSVEELEILLWLRRSGQDATVAELAEKLRSTSSSVTTRLEYLVRRVLVAPGMVPGSYRYAPESPVVDEVVAQLGDCYRDAPHKVMELVYSKPVDKIQTFADAFRLAKKEKG